jgi:2-phospho-L-lactate/phosphoenolpyruvate guanylyltransferase
MPLRILRMKTVAIVPVKNLSQAKTRLSSVLSKEERALLARDMLAHVLGALSKSGAIDRVAVISPEPDALDLHASVVALEQDRPGLNNLLEQGREWAVHEGADALLVVFADLPLLSLDDISRMVKLGRADDTVVLAPDRHSAGTNAFLSHPVKLARFAFGPSSFDAHVALARQAGAHIQVYNSAGTSLDIDTLDDLAQLEAHRVANAMQFAFS